MLAKLSARAKQAGLEFGHVLRSVESLGANLYHLSHRPQGIADRPELVVLTDRRSVKHALSLCMLLGAIPRVEVKVVRDQAETARLVQSYAGSVGNPDRMIVLSRLVYAKYYPLLQAIRAVSRVIVV